MKNININEIFEIMIEYIEHPESILIKGEKKKEVKKVVLKDEKEDEEINSFSIKHSGCGKSKENKCC